MFHLRRSVVIAAVVGVALACGNIREDELECEEAVSRLIECCPGFDSTPISCVFSQDGCADATTTSPAISIPDSECIQSESCPTLVATGVCVRAGKATSVSTYPDNPEPPPTPPSVCP